MVGLRTRAQLRAALSVDAEDEALGDTPRQVSVPVEPHIQSPSSASSASSDSSSCIETNQRFTLRTNTNMTSRIDDKVAVFEQLHPSKLPLVSPGVLTPSVWAEIKCGLREFCLHKKIPEEDRAKMVIAAFRDVEIAEDLENNYDEVVKLSLDALMNRIRDNFMPKDWADA
ncbi:hypothetical protein C0991_007360, partial [Blastosporella zonata]